MEKKVLFVGDDGGFCENLSPYFSKGGYSLFHSGARAEQIESAVNALSPRLMLFYCQSVDENAKRALLLLQRLRAVFPVMVLCPSASAEDERLAYLSGADDYIQTPVFYEYLYTRADFLVSRNEKVRLHSEKIYALILQVLRSVGIKPHLNGYAYIRDGVILALEDPAVLSKVMLKLYPCVAKLHHTTPSRVERSMRNAVSIAWETGSTQQMERYFYSSRLTGEKRPSNSTVIAAIADEITQRILTGEA